MLIEDCEIPLFLRDRKYADFRNSFDKGFEELIVATAKCSNLYQRRLFLENHEFDYSMDWGIIEGLLNLRYTFVDQKPDLRMTFLTEVTIIANNKITEEYSQALKKNRESEYIQAYCIKFKFFGILFSYCHYFLELSTLSLTGVSKSIKPRHKCLELFNALYHP